MGIEIVVAAAITLGGPAPDRPCRVAALDGVEPTARQARTVRTSCLDARRRFAELFGEPAPTVRIVIWDRSGYRTAVDGNEAVVFWAMAEGGDPAMLPHEIAHVLLAARYADAAPGPEVGRAGYGTPLPDWLEEGVAIWAEPADQREARVARARRLAPHYLDLPAILGGSHPAAADPAILAVRDGAPTPDDDDLQAFYPQSIAVLSFLFDQGGPAAVREVADRYARDPHTTRGVAGVPGMPTDEAELIRAWNAWLRAGD